MKALRLGNRDLILLSALVILAITAVLVKDGPFVGKVIPRRNALRIGKNEFYIPEIDKRLKVREINTAVGGGRETKSDYVHYVDFLFERPNNFGNLNVTFSNKYRAPFVIDLAEESEEYASYPYYNIGIGIMGGPRSYCDGIVSGEVKIDKYKVNSKGFMKYIKGTINATYRDCSIELLGIENQNTTFIGNFDIENTPYINNFYLIT